MQSPAQDKSPSVHLAPQNLNPCLGVGDCSGKAVLPWLQTGQTPLRHTRPRLTHMARTSGQSHCFLRIWGLLPRKYTKVSRTTATNLLLSGDPLTVREHRQSDGPLCCRSDKRRLARSGCHAQHNMALFPTMSADDAVISPSLWLISGSGDTPRSPDTSPYARHHRRGSGGRRQPPRLGSILLLLLSDCR